MTSRYAVDIDVLPESIVSRIREKLNYKKQIISFRADPASDLTKSETLIDDPTLIAKCREYLTTTNSKTRNVYFKGTSGRIRSENPKKPIAEALLKQGYSAQTVADVIGVSRITICRWYKSYRSRGRPGHTEDVSATVPELMAGVERLCELQKPALDLDILTPDDADAALKELADLHDVAYTKIKTRAKILGKALKAAGCL